MKAKARARLSPSAATFVLEYLVDSNGTRAYRASHPRCQSDTAAAVGAYQALRNPQIAAALLQARTEQFKRLEMHADEALALISGDARADPTRLFDDNGVLLPMQKWPADVRRSVKRIKHTDAGVEVWMNDSLRARELMAQAGGKLKTVVRHEFDLAKYLGEAPPPADEDV